TLSGGAQISSAADKSGSGGAVKVTGETMSLATGSTISAASLGTGNAGTITLNTVKSFLAQNSTLTTEAQNADGGTIQLSGGKLVYLFNSEVSAINKSRSYTQGYITIDQALFFL